MYRLQTNIFSAFCFSLILSTKNLQYYCLLYRIGGDPLALMSGRTPEQACSNGINTTWGYFFLIHATNSTMSPFSSCAFGQQYFSHKSIMFSMSRVTQSPSAIIFNSSRCLSLKKCSTTFCHGATSDILQMIPTSCDICH